MASSGSSTPVAPATASGGTGVETADKLGYGGYDVPTIPDAWIEQFGCGPELSTQAAMAEPDAEAATGSCEQ